MVTQTHSVLSFNICNKGRPTVPLSFLCGLNLLCDVFELNSETLKIDVLLNFVSLRVSYIITEDIFCRLQDLMERAVSKNVAFYNIFIKS